MKTFGEYDEDTAANWFNRQTPLGLFVKGAAVLIALSIVIGTIGFIGGWFNAAKDVVSPTNVKNQYEFAYTFNNSLEATAQQWCSAKTAEDAETNPDYKSQRVSQRLVIEQNYARIAGQYNSALQNAFKAKYVAPPDVPKSAPTLVTKTKVLCPNA